VWDGHFHVLALVNWIAAILVPLMIDGLMVISAAALLLPAQRTTVIEHGFRGHALPAPASTAALEALAQRLAEAERAVVMQADEIARLAAAKRRPRPEPAAPPPSDVPTAHQQWLAHRAQHGTEPDMEKVRGWLLAEGRTLEPNSVRAQMSRWRNPKVSTSA